MALWVSGQLVAGCRCDARKFLSRLRGGDEASSVAGTPLSLPRPTPPPVVTGHPRLWLTAAELPRLRTWAVPSNPLYAAGLGRAIADARADYDAGKVPSDGECVMAGIYCEQYALLFAFESLLAQDEAARRDAATRARNILMTLIERALQGSPKDPLREARFSIHNRSRWSGEALPLTVDWIYWLLTPAEKAEIRKVFLRWAEQQLRATATGMDHPEPVGLLQDARLIQDVRQRRYGANNYFAAHLRNLTLMSLALDASDDPAEPRAARAYPRLRDYLSNAVGAWLYVSDATLRQDAEGGISPEGYQYAGRSLAFLLQTYLALETAGEAEAGRFGPQTVRALNPFWQQLVPAYLASLSPGRVKSPRTGRSVYQPAWFGDAEAFELFDYIDVFAPLALSAERHQERGLLEAIRWLQLHTPAGGTDSLMRRARGDGTSFRQAIFYFLLYPPDAPPPRDPRAGLPTWHVAPGTGQLLARTSWAEDASLMHFQCGWAMIDHQHGDAGSFSWWRRGEWLTKERVGYGPYFERSEQHNTLAIANERPQHAEDERRGGFWQSGSQWVLTQTAGPRFGPWIVTDEYAAAYCDATPTYDSAYEGSNAVTRATRQFLWLRPDVVLLHDRASTEAQPGFIRFWLHTASPPTLSPDRATALNASGQRLEIYTLLPGRPERRASAFAEGGDWTTRPAAGENLAGDLCVEDAEHGGSAEFLHVLVARDAQETNLAVSRLRTPDSAPWVGAAVGEDVVVFVETTEPPSLEFTVPSEAQRLYVVGLTPGRGYAVQVLQGSAERTVRVAANGAVTVGAGGVLRGELR